MALMVDFLMVDLIIGVYSPAIHVVIWKLISLTIIILQDEAGECKEVNNTNDPLVIFIL